MTTRMNKNRYPRKHKYVSIKYETWKELSELKCVRIDGKIPTSMDDVLFQLKQHWIRTMKDKMIDNGYPEEDIKLLVEYLDRTEKWRKFRRDIDRFDGNQSNYYQQ